MTHAIRFFFMALGFVMFVAIGVAALVAFAGHFRDWLRDRKVDEFAAARTSGVGDIRVQLTADSTQFQTALARAGKAAGDLQFRHRPRCRNNHLRTSENTYVNPTTGKRSCRDCRRARTTNKENQ